MVPGDIFDEEVGGVVDALAGSNQQGQSFRLSAFVDVGSQITIGCAGAILSYIQRRRSAAFLPGDEASLSLFRVTSIAMFSLHGVM